MIDTKALLSDNPASRLLNIINTAIRIEYGNNDQSSKIWAEVLRVENRPSKLLPAYSELFVLTESAYDAVIRFYPKQTATHSKWKNEIIEILTKNSPYHHPWSQVLTKLKSPNILDMLQVAEDSLAHYVMKTYVNELSIEKLKIEFADLLEKISLEQSFSDPLKQFLIAELRKILDSLEHFDLYGSSPVRSSIYNILTNSDLQKAGDFSFRKILRDFLVVAAASISIINDVADLPDSLEYLNEKIFQSAGNYARQIEWSPFVMTNQLVIPERLALFRKEEGEELIDEDQPKRIQNSRSDK